MHLGRSGIVRGTLTAAAVLLAAAPTALAAPAKVKQLSADSALLSAPLAESLPTPANLPQRQENLEVVGRFQVPGVRLGQIADLAVHKGYAYLNSWDDPNCTGGGTYVVDIRNPGQPRQVNFIPAPPNFYHGEGAHVVSVNTPQFRGDILAVNDEPYGSNLTVNSPPCADDIDLTSGGFDLYNVTNPARPIPLVQGAGDTDPDNDPATPDREVANSYHSVFVWQDGPRAYLVASDNSEFTDVDIFDITDPTAPVQVGDHDLVELFPEILDGEEASGGTVLHHDVVVKRIGGRQVMKSDYWDAGYVQLDVSDPANPVLINDTTFAGEDPLLPGTGLTPEGNAHQGEFSFDNQFLLTADEDFGAYRPGSFSIATGPNAGEYDAVGVGGGGAASDLPDRRLNGPVVYGGYACDASAPVPERSVIDPALDPGEEAILVVQRGPAYDPGEDYDGDGDTANDPDDACFPGDKAANAAEAGWDAVLFANRHQESGDPADDSANCGFGGFPAGLLIPGVCTTHEALHLMFNDTPEFGVPYDHETDLVPIGTLGEEVNATSVFDGWGYAHLYDARTAEEIDAYAIPEALDPRFAAGFGDLSIHEFATDPTENLAYSSYYAGGIRVFRFSRQNGLVPTGAWIAPGGSNFWGIEQFTTPGGQRLIAGSDRDYGMVILRYTGPGAAQPPSCSNSSARTRPRRPVELALTCTDPNGNPLRRRIVGGPANGTLGPIQGDSVLYTPNRGFRGTDAVRFVANDGAADSQPATASVTVRRPPSNRVKLKIGRYKNGRVVVVVRVPGPGLLRVGMRANLPRGRASAAKVKRLARVTKRPRRAGRVRAVLKLSRAERRQMARVLEKRRVKAKINTSFKPTGGTTGKRSRTLVIPKR